LTLLRDGMNSQLDPELLGEAPQQRDTCVARRRVHYYRQVAAAGDLSSRLALTTIEGLPAVA
ncbi:MAG TPA: FliA/WhiG family RNA polymerase sigma factor, partial [Pilimelia sp.]|nr:FliA/WhiG family RNA polymerase sigma factor [Pilimelia sp.]